MSTKTRFEGNSEMAYCRPSGCSTPARKMIDRQNGKGAWGEEISRAVRVPYSFSPYAIFFLSNSFALSLSQLTKRDTRNRLILTGYSQF